ncbi:MAG: SDR family oxidoreductase [Nitrospirota bacterium]|nr:SDR family oxidoreductase [Nitrospirota bacterium]
MARLALITGAAGLIGHYLLTTAPRWASRWEVRGITRQDVDLTDAGAVRRLWRDLHPHAVIHCAAQSRTGLCQQDPTLAQRINVKATALLAELAAGIPFLFLSSDQVFDGSKGWYVETDPVNPLNVYGETKAEAERIVLQNPRHSVIRVALNAGTSPTGDRSFVEDMRNSLKGGTLLTLFTDEFRCPLPAGMTARALWELIDQDRPGLYHLGGAERLSRWEIGQALISWYPELAGQIQPDSVGTYTGAPRPPDLSMRCDKLQGLLSFPLSGLRAWLAGRTSAGQDLWDYPEGSL